MPTLTISKAGPGLTVQDLGRPGWTAQGLSTGGAVDRLALIEAAALLGTPPTQAVIEMMGMGGSFTVDEGTRFALTGAQMDAQIDGAAVGHNRSGFLPAGATLTVGTARQGVFGYLAFAGGIATPPVMNSRATHLTAGIGARLQAGDRLPLGADDNRPRAPQKLSVPHRFGGGTIRIMAGPQTDLFDRQTRDTFAATPFKRSARGNRQGVRLDHDGTGFACKDGLNLVSDIIVPGDIQITGEGVPYILLAECQTIGGYPRIGTVLPADLPKVAQAAPGAPLRFVWVTTQEADSTTRPLAAQLRDLAGQCQPVVRDPHDIADLLGYQLISGATRGDDLERPQDETQD